MTVTVSNRDLLRKFKDLKSQLMSGDVEEVIIPQSDDIIIKMRIEKKETPFQQLVRMVKDNPVLNVKRTDQDFF